MTPKQKDKLLTDTINQINSGVFESLKALEQEIGELVAAGIDPIVARSQIVGAFNRYAENAVTGISVKEVADTSNRSILNQIMLDENSYTEMIKEQRGLIEEYRSKSERLEEEVRLLKLSKSN